MHKKFVTDDISLDKVKQDPIISTLPKELPKILLQQTLKRLGW